MEYEQNRQVSPDFGFLLYFSRGAFRLENNHHRILRSSEDQGSPLKVSVCISGIADKTSCPSVACRVVSSSLPCLHRAVVCLNKVRWCSKEETWPVQATLALALAMVSCGYLPHPLLRVVFWKHEVLEP